VRLLPYALCVPAGSFLVNVLLKKIKRLPPVYLVLFGAMLQLSGLALFAALTNSPDPGKKQYGFQALAGLGLGMAFGTLVVMIPFAVEDRDIGEPFYRQI
jgi:drug/metabolite transporter (DMT)-like permease